MERVSTRHAGGALAQTLLGFALVSLVVIGIGGTIYMAIEPEGWLAHLFGRDFPGSVAMLVTFAAIWALAWLVRSISSASQQGAAVDLIVYGFAAAGLLYVGRFWIGGSF